MKGASTIISTFFTTALKEQVFINEAVGKFVCDLFKEDLFKLKFYSVKTSS